MPILRDNGNGTFTIDSGEWGGDSGAIERQTAERYAFAPQARQELGQYDVQLATPAQGRAGVYESWRSLDRFPWQQSGIELTTPLNPYTKKQPEEILAHEWAHRNYYETLPGGMRADWERQGPQIVGPANYEQAARTYYSDPTGKPPVPTYEVYAQVGSNPQILARMQPDVRQRLFPYLDASVWNQRHAEWANSWPAGR
jgi:hypothetical protein